MIPVRDENPTSRSAVLTLLLIVVNTAVFLLLQPHGNKSVLALPKPSTSLEFGTADELRFNLAYAAIPCEIVKRRPLRVAEVVRTFRFGDETACGSRLQGVAGQVVGADTPAFPGKRPLLALIVSMFLHANLAHLGGNMLFLWIFGNNIEDHFGKLRFLLFYLAGGIAAAAAHVLVQPSSTVPIIGASGAIAAVMGAYLVLFPRARVTTFAGFFLVPLPAAVVLGIWFVTQFFVGADQGIAWVAHVGGFVFGVVVAAAGRLLGNQAGPPTPRASPQYG